jgi:hypothetical protein
VRLELGNSGRNMTSSRSIPVRIIALILAAFAFSVTSRALADTSIIKNPGDHSRYVFEPEPHLLVGWLDAPGVASGAGIGLGFRGTVILVNNGFIRTINNSVGIGFGIDWVHYSHRDDWCNTGPGGGCYSGSQSVNNFWFPVVMQWNFFLTRQWSVFGEPGLALRYSGYPDGHDLQPEPVLDVGGRWHFSDSMTLTMRIGYPTFSVGVSFM